MTARETAADELTKAERWARKYALYAEMAPSSRRMVTLMAEYDERGRELTAAQAANQRVRELAEEYQRGPASGPSAVHEHIATRILRALDGDTP